MGKTSLDKGIDKGKLKASVLKKKREVYVPVVPDQQFGSSYGDTVVNVVNWLNSADLTGFVCQNGIQRLFDSGRWTQQNARAYLGALIQMWNQWGQQYARVRI